MKKRKTLPTVALLAGILMLGIGYAAVAARNMMVSGTAGNVVDNANFKVGFDNSVAIGTQKTDYVNVSSNFDDDSQEDTGSDNASARALVTMSVTGLKKNGDYAEQTYTIKNYSEELVANLALGTKNVQKGDSYSVDTTEYFNVNCTLGAKTSLVPDDTTTVTCRVTLTKTPVNEVGIKFTQLVVATPSEATA